MDENAKVAAKPAAADRGQTFINDEVISVIARMAAESVAGVHQIGESSLRTLVPSFQRHHGVDSEVGLHEAAIDIDVIVEYGHAIRDITQEMRKRVIEAVESMTGRRVVEVNLFVVDVKVPRGASEKRHRHLE